jgi:pimeloyl-ACP methyl ester carboxylesterase
MPYANSQGVRIHYQIEGAGVPLVLQHGFSDSLESWYEQGYVERLQDAYQLILIDARGHGASDKPHDSAAYDFQSNVADILAVLDALHIPTAHFLGYSMGGQIGFALAQYAAARFASLIIGGADPYRANSAEYEAWLRTLQHSLCARLGATGAGLPHVADTPAGKRCRSHDRLQGQTAGAPRVYRGLADDDHAVLTLCGRGGQPLCRGQGMQGIYA